MRKLVEEVYKVLIETSGALPVKNIPDAVHVIMDIKCPDSKMADRNLWDNIAHIKSKDEIKFVVASRSDFDWVCGILKEFDLEKRCHILLSPAWGLVAPKDLVSWILESRINCRLNIQQHKYIWSPREKGV